MKITYIFRHPSQERSIERVFAPIIERMRRDGNDVCERFVSQSRIWPITMAYNIVRYASLSRMNGVYHITGDVQYVACLMNRETTVMTIHDCVVLHNDNVPRWLHQMVYKLWYEIPLRRLKYITCISETTRQDLIKLFPWVADKLFVIPNSVGEEFVYSPKQINIKYPRILHVGTRTNKNLERVIQALQGIPCLLVIIGKLSTEQLELLSKTHVDYINRFNIPDFDILEEYKQADIISFPSLFEGFGMPIIEGQAIGRPIITSDREPMRSVAGKGAMLVNPESVASIRNGFLQLIGDEQCCSAMIEFGLENAKQYSVDSIADKYYQLYKRILPSE